MRRLGLAVICSIGVFTFAAANASANTPTWFECAKAVKIGTSYSGHYTSRACEAGSEVETGGRYELKEGVGTGRRFKGRGGSAVLEVTTTQGDIAVECASATESGQPALPNLETAVSLTYKRCAATGGKTCTSAGARAGEIAIGGLRGEFGDTEEEAASVVDLKLESETRPGPSGEIVTFSCEGLQATVTGSLTALQRGDVNRISREFATVDLAAEPYSGPEQSILNKGRPLMISTGPQPSEPPGGILIGEVVPHENGGDAKEEEITPVKFKAKKTGTVEAICFETSGYLYPPVQKSLVLGIEEDNMGVPGKVLAEGTYAGKLGENAIARVGGFNVPIVKGKTYYLDFLPLGGTVTYWYGKSETVIYSTHHKQLVEGLPEDYEWQEEAEEAPIGIWAEGT